MSFGFAYDNGAKNDESLHIVMDFINIFMLIILVTLYKLPKLYKYCIHYTILFNCVCACITSY